MQSPSLTLPLPTSAVRRPPAAGSLGYRAYVALHARGRPGLALWALLLLP